MKLRAGRKDPDLIFLTRFLARSNPTRRSGGRPNPLLQDRLRRGLVLRSDRSGRSDQPSQRQHSGENDQRLQATSAFHFDLRSGETVPWRPAECQVTALSTSIRPRRHVKSFPE